MSGNTNWIKRDSNAGRLKANNPTHNTTPKILVIGGTGYFGRLLVKELLEYTSGDILIAGRDQRRLLATCRSFEPAFSSRLTTKELDLTQEETVATALANVQVAICAAGPFQALPTTLVKICLDRRVHYIDLADDRRFVKNVHALVHERHNDPDLPAACTGWSAVPALSGVLARIAADGMDQIEEIYIQIAPGNRVPRARGTVTSLLASVGHSFDVLQHGKWHRVTGWSQPRRFSFPQPVGDRVGYLVDVPDHELFPRVFGARRVEFRVGSELSFLNHAVSLLAWTARTGLVRNWAPLAPVSRACMAVFRFLGHDWGAVGVEVFGRKGHTDVCRQVSVVADHMGHRIPVMPAVVMTQQLTSRQSTHHGLVPVDNWITRDQLASECDRRGYRLVVEDVDRGAGKHD